MPRKEMPSNKPVIARVICMMFVCVGFVIIALSLISFSPADPSHMTVRFPSPEHTHNWCKTFGAAVAYWGMYRIGPGIYVALVFTGIALVMWTKGSKISGSKSSGADLSRSSRAFSAGSAGLYTRFMSRAE